MGFGWVSTYIPQGPSLLHSPQAYERQVPPRSVINSAGYKILTSVDQYLELVGNSLPGKGAPIPGRSALHRPGAWQGERAAPILERQAPHLQKGQLGLELPAGTQHHLMPPREEAGGQGRLEARLDLFPAS